jgi:hypothetical protein
MWGLIPTKWETLRLKHFPIYMKGKKLLARRMQTKVVIAILNINTH